MIKLSINYKMYDKKQIKNTNSKSCSDFDYKKARFKVKHRLYNIYILYKSKSIYNSYQISLKYFSKYFKINECKYWYLLKS